MKKNVKDIHNEKRVFLWNQNMENRKTLVDNSTGLLKSDFVEERLCPVCKGSKSQKMFTKGGGQYVKCNSCSMVYLNPVFTDAALKEYYSNSKMEQGEVVADDLSFYTDLYTRGLNMAQSRTSVGNILDIGCSTGIFLDIAKENGWNTFGLELNKIEFDIAKSKGHKVLNSLLEHADFSEKFNIVSLWDVFEHIKDGNSALNLISNVLTDEGVILMQIPSSDSLAARIMQKNCNMFDGLEHVNLYGVASLEVILKNNGLKILDIKSVIPELGVVNNYLNYDDPYGGDSNNFTSILGLLSARQILESLLGYKLQVVVGRE